MTEHSRINQSCQDRENEEFLVEKVEKRLDFEKAQKQLFPADPRTQTLEFQKSICLLENALDEVENEKTVLLESMENPDSTRELIHRINSENVCKINELTEDYYC